MDLSPAREYGEANRARARILRGYERSMERLAPLEREIGYAEPLADALVYRLYGLGAAEAAVVEGR